MTARAPHVHALHVERAVTHVANRDRAIGAAAGAYAAEGRRAGHGELAGERRRRRRRSAGSRGRHWSLAIVADFGPKLAGWEADRRRERVARTDRDRVREHLGHEKLR